MSKDIENPFAQLDIRRFPQSRSPRKTGHGNAVSRMKSVPEAADEDAALFLNALGDDVQAFEKGCGGKKRAAPKRTPGDAERLESEGTFDRVLREEQQGGMKLKEKFNVVFSHKAAEAGGSQWMAEAESPLEAVSGGPPSLKAGCRGGSVEASGRSEAQDEEELAQFMAAMKGATPLHARGRDVPREVNGEVSAPGGQPHTMQDVMDGPLEFAVCCRDEYAEGHVVGLDPMLLEQLKARQFSPEAHIDLHGLNSDQAYWNLLGFFRGAYFKGLRMAVVVTGRGLNSPSCIPVLKMHVQQWMTQDPLKRVVLAFCSARQEDGGTGAFYVLLRKRKKSAGKICWTIAPGDAGIV